MTESRFLVAWRQGREREGEGGGRKDRLQRDMKKLLRIIRKKFLFIVLYLVVAQFLYNRQLTTTWSYLPETLYFRDLF